MLCVERVVKVLLGVVVLVLWCHPHFVVLKLMKRTQRIHHI
jgi:hypothetical protein